MSVTTWPQLWGEESTELSVADVVKTMTIEPPTLRERLRRWMGSTVASDLRPFAPALAAINALEPALERAADTELAARAGRLASLARRGAADADLVVETFALVREAARRRLGLRLFDEQVLAGLAMGQSRIAEMQTGEGKTLAAVAPAALAALGGRGVHVLTVNDYLARRDAAWMGPVYACLGLSVGVVQDGTAGPDRRRAYAADVTYVTAKQAGFDFLRDRLSLDAADLVHRSLASAIVDEADSILIDEARVPLVVAGGRLEHTDDLTRLAGVVRQLAAGRDFDTDEYRRNINLTEQGSQRVEELLGCGNLYAPENLPLLVQMRNALHAEVLLGRDVDYIVRGGRVELVDELTGRVVRDRQWPDGLQAALEAKEGLRLQPEGRILGSITMQHFIGQYPRLCGMTATAAAAATELDEFYGLGVTLIPTHRPSVRVDHPDVIFTGRDAKERAVVGAIAAASGSGRPILVGTASVEESERLAARLAAAGVACRVLNAKHDEAEAAVVAEAGAPGAVTISTNMAGRGTDIRLGGHDEARRAEVVALGGLLVIGTNRHESGRIDDQLRGRAGRQGDPGASRFFVSLEDELMTRYRLRDLVPASRWPAPGDEPVDDPVLRHAIARTQRIVDGQNFDIRRTLWKYAQVVDEQRAYLQDWRQALLAGDTEPDLVAARRPERHARLSTEVGADAVRAIERRLTLLAIDKCWSDHLAGIGETRDGIHLVSLAGKDPYEQFHARARGAFETTLAQIDAEVLETFDRLVVTADGADWAGAGLLGPSSTWTYLVTDRPFLSGPLAAMAGRPSTGLPVAAIYAPLWIVWGFYQRLTRGRRKNRAA